MLPNSPRTLSPTARLRLPVVSDFLVRHKSYVQQESTVTHVAIIGRLFFYFTYVDQGKFKVDLKTTQKS